MFLVCVSLVFVCDAFCVDLISDDFVLVFVLLCLSCVVCFLFGVWCCVRCCVSFA